MTEFVLISGASGTIGNAIVEAQLRRGQNVICVSRRNKRDKPSKPNQFWIEFDYCSDTGLAAFEKELAKIVGQAGLSSTFLCAGARDIIAPADARQSDYTEALLGNFFPTSNMIKGVMDNMKLGGSIIVVNSQAASSPSMNEITYGVAKRAISSLIDSLQFEATDRRLQIVNVLLGAVASNMTAGRAEKSKLINPDELAETLIALSGVGMSIRLKDVEILRRLY